MFNKPIAWRLFARLMALFFLIGPCVALANEAPVLREYRLADFSKVAYEEAVEALLVDFEQASGKPCTPGPKGRVALKVSTVAGEGLSTPRALVQAVITALCKRGYTQEAICIFDQSERQLREAGFLPPLSMGTARLFGRSPVYTLEDMGCTDSQWFYESPLPPLLPVVSSSSNWAQLIQAVGESKRSYLPAFLFFDVDFWINLPVVMDSAALGVAGALANATLWNVTNTARFWQSPSYAPVAVAEIAAIAEFKNSLAFTILSLEAYQYVGEARFNARYTASEKRLWLSKSAVFLDYAMLGRLNFCRRKKGFAPYEPTPRLFSYAQAIGLGDYEGGYVISVLSK